MIVVRRPEDAEARLADAVMCSPRCGSALAKCGYARERTFRALGAATVTVRPRRVRCRDCAITHILLPTATPEVIGTALAHKANGLGFRRIAARMGRAESTVRRWLRRATDKLDGRVVRRDEGGDVVSEGQAYGMLIAEAVGHETRFRSIWEWTNTHLRLADGLLALRWADNNRAADADLDAARSLVLADRRFNAPELTEDGKRLGAAILETETVAVGTGAAPPSDVNPQGTWVAGSGRVLVAGNWLRRRRTSSTRGTSVRAPNGNSTRHQPTGGGRASLAPQRVLGWQLIGNRDAAARLGHRD